MPWVWDGERASEVPFKQTYVEVLWPRTIRPMPSTPYSTGCPDLCANSARASNRTNINISICSTLVFGNAQKPKNWSDIARYERVGAAARAEHSIGSSKKMNKMQHHSKIGPILNCSHNCLLFSFFIC